MDAPDMPTIAVSPALTCHKSHATRARGFTLVELAIVLFIVALLLGGMLMPLSAQQEVRARQESERQLEDIREALYGFAAVNGRLPRPAVSALDGSERAECATDADCHGFIPWAALGVKRADSWNKLIRYSVTPAFASSSTALSLTSLPNRTVQTRDTGGNLVYLAGSAACTTASACVPAVVFAQAKGRQGVGPENDVFADDSATNTDEDDNDNPATSPTTYISRTASDNTATGGGEFDDQLIWISSNTLFNRLISAGRL
jgi:prepilin-type N-terminal cleavage/methylation domain-containing protein